MALKLGASRPQSKEISGPKPIIYQGDLNVAASRELDAWGTTDAEYGNWKASGRTREETAAFELMLRDCGQKEVSLLSRNDIVGM